ncbi:type II toxin-antitoxin system RelE/ParE family toxin [Nocardia asiatica]|uniref:type II toxin-antitoxin system RelE/ParE family toxin n=1 Tax=Nocardia asiatica TaxID=209252 RepID=UPI003EE41B77
MGGKAPLGRICQSGVLYRSACGQGATARRAVSRQLDGKLRELRFYMDSFAVRLTYWIAPGRRIVMLTVFVKTRMREHAEIERARRAFALCIAERHTAEEDEVNG